MHEKHAENTDIDFSMNLSPNHLVSHLEEATSELERLSKLLNNAERDIVHERARSDKLVADLTQHWQTRLNVQRDHYISTQKSLQRDLEDAAKAIETERRSVCRLQHMLKRQDEDCEVKIQSVLNRAEESDFKLQQSELRYHDAELALKALEDQLSAAQSRLKVHSAVNVCVECGSSTIPSSNSPRVNSSSINISHSGGNVTVTELRDIHSSPTLHARLRQSASNNAILKQNHPFSSQHHPHLQIPNMQPNASPPPPSNKFLTFARSASRVSSPNRLQVQHFSDHSASTGVKLERSPLSYYPFRYSPTSEHLHSNIHLQHNARINTSIPVEGHLSVPNLIAPSFAPLPSSNFLVNKRNPVFPPEHRIHANDKKSPSSPHSADLIGIEHGSPLRPYSQQQQNSPINHAGTLIGKTHRQGNTSQGISNVRSPLAPPPAIADVKGEENRPSRATSSNKTATNIHHASINSQMATSKDESSCIISSYAPLMLPPTANSHDPLDDENPIVFNLQSRSARNPAGTSASTAGSNVFELQLQKLSEEYRVETLENTRKDSSQSFFKTVLSEIPETRPSSSVISAPSYNPSNNRDTTIQDSSSLLKQLQNLSPDDIRALQSILSIELNQR